jgi:UDP-N-acetylglucosamine--N-acetylmuramyl-(pentapeptide) pyrophosphoryl-undecaprenol N-acetylglucosamine transferase
LFIGVETQDVQKKILILAAGGGHTGYAYALAEELYPKVTLSFLVPYGDSLSAKRLGKFGQVGFLLKAREPKTPNHVFAVRLIKAFLDSFRLDFRQFDVVVSAGSNFCIPPAIVAWLSGVPIVNIESPIRFVKPAKSTRLLQHFSAITALHWKEQTKLLKGIVVGPILPKPEVEPRNKGYILVSGGTYGHKLLFDTLAESSLPNIVLQTGKVNPLPYVKRHPQWKALTVTDRFPELIANADLVVTHLGVTVLEAMVYKKPVVLVPNPEWTRTGTLEDAKQLARKIDAVLVSEIKLETLLKAIQEARKRAIPAFPDGAKNLANIIKSL